MKLLFENFSELEDKQDYLNLLNIDMEVIRGKFMHNFSKGKEEKQLEIFLKSNLTKIFTLKSNGETIGFTIYTLVEDNTLFVEQLHIKPEFRGKGFGMKTLTFLESQAKDLGCLGLDLEVYVSNPAYHLYKRFGLEKIGFYKNICWWIHKVRKPIFL